MQCDACIRFLISIVECFVGRNNSTFRIDSFAFFCSFISNTFFRIHFVYCCSNTHLFFINLVLSVRKPSKKKSRKGSSKRRCLYSSPVSANKATIYAPVATFCIATINREYLVHRLSRSLSCLSLAPVRLSTSPAKSIITISVDSFRSGWKAMAGQFWSFWFRRIKRWLWRLAFLIIVEKK